MFPTTITMGTVLAYILSLRHLALLLVSRSQIAVLTLAFLLSLTTSWVLAANATLSTISLLVSQQCRKCGETSLPWSILTDLSPCPRTSLLIPILMIFTHAFLLPRHTTLWVHTDEYIQRRGWVVKTAHLSISTLLGSSPTLVVWVFNIYSTFTLVMKCPRHASLELTVSFLWHDHMSFLLYVTRPTVPPPHTFFRASQTRPTWWLDPRMPVIVKINTPKCVSDMLDTCVYMPSQCPLRYAFDVILCGMFAFFGQFLNFYVFPEFVSFSFWRRSVQFGVAPITQHMGFLRSDFIS